MTCPKCKNNVICGNDCETMYCPRCGKNSNYGDIICDNDCGTMECEFCHLEWYVNPNTEELISGHCPDCDD